LLTQSKPQKWAHRTRSGCTGPYWRNDGIHSLEASKQPLEPEKKEKVAAQRIGVSNMARALADGEKQQLQASKGQATG